MSERVNEQHFMMYPTCPWCGHKDESWWQWVDRFMREHGDDSAERECPSCHQIYQLEVVQTVEFTSWGEAQADE